MATRQKKPVIPAYKQAREFKVRLPPEISKRIEDEAAKEGCSQSKIIVEDLRDIPDLRSQATALDLVGDMEHMLRRYGARLTYAELTDELLFAIRAADEANTAGKISELRAAMDQVNLILRDWEQLDRHMHAAEPPHKLPAITRTLRSADEAERRFMLERAKKPSVKNK
jgi:hypothetical protein